AVLGQQVSVPAARTLAGRLANRFGTRLETAEGSPSVLFPRPADLADADLSGLGLTTTRQATLRALAAAAADGTLELDHGAAPQEPAAGGPDVRGWGPWPTPSPRRPGARDPAASPAADLGLRRALGHLGGTAGRSDRWRPWRAYAAVHLWTWSPGGPATDGGSPPVARPASTSRLAAR